MVLYFRTHLFFAKSIPSVDIRIQLWWKSRLPNIWTLHCIHINSSNIAYQLIEAHFMESTHLISPVFLGVETRRFGNWIYFRPQVKGGADTDSVGYLRKSWCYLFLKAQLSRCIFPPSSEDGNRSSFRNVVFLLPKTLDDEESPKTQ
jgi:hypothetical protein